MTHPFSTIAAIFAAFCLMLYGIAASADSVPVRPNPLAKMAWANKAKAVAVVPVAAPAPPATPATTIQVPSKSMLMFVNIGGAGGLNAVPWSKSLSFGPVAGLILDFGFGALASGSDHWHVSVVVGASSLTSYATSKTVAAAVIGLMPGYQPALNAPIYGLGAAAFCDGKDPCAYGFIFTTALAGTVAKLGFSVPGG